MRPELAGEPDRRLSGELLPRDERSSKDDQETKEEPHGGLQGRGGAGGGQGGTDGNRDRVGIRRPPQPGSEVKEAAAGASATGFREGESAGGGRPQRKGAERQDRPAGDGERFFSGCAREASRDERKEMISPEHPLPTTRQRRLPELSRSPFY